MSVQRLAIDGLNVLRRDSLHAAVGKVDMQNPALHGLQLRAVNIWVGVNGVVASAIGEELLALVIIAVCAVAVWAALGVLATIVSERKYQELKDKLSRNPGALYVNSNRRF